MVVKYFLIKQWSLNFSHINVALSCVQNLSEILLLKVYMYRDIEKQVN